MQGLLTTREERLAFMLAGNATFTVQSRETGKRFTFKVQAPKDGNPIRFVKLLCGPDNTADFQYFGVVRIGPDGEARFQHASRRTRIGADAPGALAFGWFMRQPGTDRVDFYHEGRCGRCNRKLTVPESVASGIGPECAGRL